MDLARNGRRKNTLPYLLSAKVLGELVRKIDAPQEIVLVTLT
jgi:hypothetical protein